MLLPVVKQPGNAHARNPPALDIYKARGTALSGRRLRGRCSATWFSELFPSVALAGPGAQLSTAYGGLALEIAPRLYEESIGG